MKILILSRYQNTVERGVETIVKELVLRLSKGHDVTVLSGKDSDSFKKIISGNYDIVMPTNGRLQSLKASAGRLFSNYKLVIGGHSGIGRDDILNILLAKPDIFIALTDHMATWAKKWAWGSKVVTINNGIDLERFNSQGTKIPIDLKSPIVLSVGSLSWYKHHERSINAISKLSDVSLLIVGKGEEESKLRQLATEKIPGRFLITSYKYEDMPKVYRSCNVFTLPSWDREAFGVVYLEAMASNIPVVAPNDLSRKEIVGSGGLLVDVNNIEDYSKEISTALNENWGDKPRKQAEKFDWEKVAKEYEHCFETLI